GIIFVNWRTLILIRNKQPCKFMRKSNFIGIICLFSWLCLICLADAYFFGNLTGQPLKSRLDIVETETDITVRANRYILLLDKATAMVRLSNRQGLLYSSFPLDVYFNGIPAQATSGGQYEWKIKQKVIYLTMSRNGQIMQQTKVSCHDDAIEIQLNSTIPSVATQGVFLLRRAQQGFDTSQWEQYFSPEPDDYFHVPPMVDVRIDRDQQWAFAPAPLNLSFKTPAGWFSVGLAELPDASIFAFKDNALWLDVPWRKLSPPSEELYPFPALVFTFNQSPWQAVADFAQCLRQEPRRNDRQSRRSPEPAWWRQPLVSTWGEQTIQELAYNHSRFNTEWVRDYVQQQKASLQCSTFTLIIDDNWSRAYGDPHPANRFRELRALIDSCHDQGLKVILFWKAWKVEANSIATNFNVLDGEYVDATHARFESYVDSCCQILFGNGPEALNADGLKLDYLFLVRDPAAAKYADPAKGMGFREVFRYLETFYRLAKKYNPEALIISTAIDPRFREIQDMVRVHEDWDHKTTREKRARIITQALPGMLINGDAADMSAKIIDYHYITSAIYGVPCIQYLSRLRDGELTDATRLMLVQLLRLYQQSPTSGQLTFVDYGHWQIRNKKNELLMESLPGGKGILVFQDKERATLLCSDNNQLLLVVEGLRLKSITDVSGQMISFKDIGQGIYELNKLQPGANYQLRFKKEFLKSQ
ncbi:MAG: hypothetical protein ONB27_10180, partial [candidate division KSB1 bacterium]|nr:hypothetical protein [candidate division KSB1 bacterium]